MMLTRKMKRISKDIFYLFLTNAMHTLHVINLPYPSILSSHFFTNSGLPKAKIFDQT